MCLPMGFLDCADRSHAHHGRADAMTDHYSIEVRDADAGTTVMRVDANWTDADRRKAIALISRLAKTGFCPSTTGHRKPRIERGPKGA